MRLASAGLKHECQLCACCFRLRSSRHWNENALAARHAQLSYGQPFSRNPLHTTSLALRFKSTATTLHVVGKTCSPAVVSADQASGESKNSTGVPSATITSFQDIHYESDVTGPIQKGRSRLVDGPSHARDLPLWAELLEFRSRLEGASGVLKVWRGLRERHVRLQTNGKLAERLWTPFIEAALHDDDVLEQIFEEVSRLKELQWYWTPFYNTLIGSLLRSYPSRVLSWHSRCHHRRLNTHVNTAKLIEDAMTSTDSLRMFRTIYRSSEISDIYGSLVPALCGQDRFEEALDWHYFLVGESDKPYDASVAAPLKSFLVTAGYRQNVRKFECDLDRAQIVSARSSSTADGDESVTQVAPRLLNRLVGNGYGFRQRIMKDSFVARLFATPGLAKEVVIVALCAFGYRELGPLALREMAARCDSAADLMEQIYQLQGNGVKTKGSVYARLIHQLAQEKNEDVLKAVLDSDEHPDVYEDRLKQKTLLRSYIDGNNWAQAHKTLMVLTTSFRSRHEATWNYVLRAYMEARNWHGVEQMVDEMLTHGISVSPRSVRRSFFTLLSRRDPGKKPISFSNGLDELTFLTKLWLKIVRSGGEIPAQAWNQLLIYYGMRNRLGELESLSIWLVNVYSKRTASMRNGRQALQLIFSPGLQEAIIAWGFKSMATHIPKTSWQLRMPEINGHKQPRSLPMQQQWQRGLFLLKTLRECGVPLDDIHVRKTCRMRIKILFGPLRSASAENKLAAAKNKISLGQMLNTMNEIWGYKLFNLPALAMGDDDALKKSIGVALESGSGPRIGASRVKQ